MKAIVCTRYGPPDVLQLKEVEKPFPKDDEVLIKVHAASVHPDVWHVVSGLPYALRLMGAGLLKPKNCIPGTDVAGHVESVGKNVTQFQPGDEVFGESTRGHQWVNGAGGGVGAFSVQLAKAFGTEVTGVDSTRKLDLVRSIGADHVIDYTQEDFTKSGERYDLIFDIPGNHSFSDCRRALTHKGTYVLIGHDHFGKAGLRWLGSLPRFFKLIVMSPFVSQLPDLNFSMPDKKDSMAVLREFIEAGKITPVVDRTFPLSEVPEAIRYLKEGNVQGKVVILLEQNNKT